MVLHHRIAAFLDLFQPHTRFVRSSDKILRYFRINVHAYINSFSIKVRNYSVVDKLATAVTC